MFEYLDIEQGTEDWFFLRRGRITSSAAGTFMANFGRPFGNPAVQYAMKIAIEGSTGRGIESFSNDYMKRGSELESEAREVYGRKCKQEVKNGGFFMNEKYGGSPDGLIKDGFIEIKCPKFSTHFNTLQRDSYDLGYKWQLVMNMWLTDSKHCDFISYCPEFPDHKALYVDRVFRDESDIEKLKTRLKEFEPIVEHYKNLLK